MPVFVIDNDREYYFRNLQVHLRVVSLEYYFYKLTAGLGANFDPFFGGSYQPISVYSNVKGGYGIFAGYNETVDSASYPVSLDTAFVANENF